MRVLLVGDCHGDDVFAVRVHNGAVEACADAVIQLGDFGWDWPGTDNAFAEKISAMASETAIPWYFLDGNHENHSTLPHDADGPVELLPALLYLPRGYAWEWNGVRCLAMGGAYSIDQWARTAGVSWWAEEIPTWAQFNRAIDTGRADIVFSHDVPSIVPVPGLHSERKDKHRPSRWARKGLTAIYDSAQPRQWFHGHHHVRYRHRLGGCSVLGLDCNYNDARAVQLIEIGSPA